jgi:hypothetical protein
MDDIEIQLQDLSGNWRTFSITLNSSQMILQEMRSLAERYPGQRVRAVDSNGKVVDIL